MKTLRLPIDKLELIIDISSTTISASIFGRGNHLAFGNSIHSDARLDCDEGDHTLWIGSSAFHVPDEHVAEVRAALEQHLTVQEAA